jgi:hypothetical protein
MIPTLWLKSYAPEGIVCESIQFIKLSYLDRAIAFDADGDALPADMAGDDNIDLPFCASDDVRQHRRLLDRGPGIQV